MRSAGAIIRVTASLIDAQTDRQLWSESYERDAKDPLPPAGRARARNRGRAPGQAVGALRGDGTAHEQRRGVPAPSAGYAAHAAMDLHSVAADLDAAIALDPRFARAWAGRANVQMGSVVQGIADASLLEKVEADAPPGALTSIRCWVPCSRSWRPWRPTAATGSPLTRDSGGVSKQTCESQDRVSAMPRWYFNPSATCGAGCRRSTSAIGSHLQIRRWRMGCLASNRSWATMQRRCGSPSSPPCWACREKPFRCRRYGPPAATRAGRHAEAAELLARSLYPPVAAVGGAEVIRAVYAALADPSRKPAAIKALNDFIARVGVPGIDMNFRKDLLVMHVQLGELDRAYSFGNRVLDEYRKKGGVGYAWGGSGSRRCDRSARTRASRNSPSA